MKVTHPLEVPPELRGYCVVLEQTGPLEDPVPAALKAGIFLTVPWLKKMRAEYRWTMPEKKKDGKKKPVGKPDFVNAMLDFFFGLAIDAEKRAFMYKALMGQRSDINGRGSAHAAEILAAFKSLDQQDQPEYVKLAAVAQDEEALKAARVERSDQKGQHASPMHETPGVLAKLLPTGADFYCSFNRHPKLTRYQVKIVDAETGASTRPVSVS